ncbi:hypothetical protein AVEN_143447-1 [Araneus ventricosus]|uniref:Uncharacterized protein n=1 Tax=Araneus ventricosus TaxID=182803 RepID=A0A4Y2SX01_ARAVE|nr:hypothetical protein AVEN_143447-1 [Araneus ventricosus]
MTAAQHSIMPLLKPPFRPFEGRGGLVVRSGLGAGGLQVRNPIPLKIRRVCGLLHAKSYVVVKRPPVGVAWKFGEGGASSGVVLVI